jgi:hypothetical protein
VDHDGYCFDRALRPEIYYYWFLGRDGYFHNAPWFFMLFWTMTGIIKFYKLWPKIYYHWVLGRDGYLHCALWFYVVSDCDRYCFVYVILNFCVSLTPPPPSLWYFYLLMSLSQIHLPLKFPYKLLFILPYLNKHHGLILFLNRTCNNFMESCWCRP